MRLDLRRPVIVVTGQWNPAIFDPNWVARHLFDVPLGQETSVMQVITPPNRVINYYHDLLGIAVSKARLELFLNDLDEGSQQRLSALLKKIFAKLPHTPIQGLGYNFHFVDEDVSEEIVDKLKTHEGLETRFTIGAQAFTSSIALEGKTLNLRRDISESSCEIDFNYHFVVNPENIDGPVLESVTELFSQAVQILREVYEVEYQTNNPIRHNFPQMPAAG